jgi:enoyl-CoA hydratase/carnithine racemase
MAEQTAVQTVRYEVGEGIATVTLDDPEVYNALDYDGYAQLSAAFRRADEDVEVRAVVFTGTDPGFCAGDNVKKLLGSGAAELSRRLSSGELELPGGPIRRCRKPVIAAVNGAAIGYGMELALLADIRIASDRARFSEMFVRRAIIAGADSFELLPAIVGAAGAAELLMGGETIDAARAEAMGLVSRVVDHGDLTAAARELAGRLAANPPLAVQAAKHALRLALTGQRAQLREFIAGAGRDLLRTEDHRESVAAFLEKRPATFNGR